ncbi:hypothetical protein D3C81_1721140 [compost metagenome]
MPGAVRAKVHENDRVILAHRLRLTNACSLYKFVRLAPLVGRIKRVFSAHSTVLCFALGNEAVCRFNTVPALVSIQGEVAPNDCGNAARAVLFEVSF